MSFRYLGRVASTESIQQFLDLADLADLAVGADQAAQNVFALSHRLRASQTL